jgi:hypothetical protein
MRIEWFQIKPVLLAGASSGLSSTIAAACPAASSDDLPLRRRRGFGARFDAALNLPF